MFQCFIDLLFGNVARLSITERTDILLYSEILEIWVHEVEKAFAAVVSGDGDLEALIMEAAIIEAGTTLEMQEMEGLSLLHVAAKANNAGQPWSLSLTYTHTLRHPFTRSHVDIFSRFPNESITHSFVAWFLLEFDGNHIQNRWNNVAKFKLKNYEEKIE